MSRYNCAFLTGWTIYQSLQVGKRMTQCALRRSAYALVVDNLHDRRKFTGMRTALKKNDSANLHKLPPGRLNVNFGHRDGRNLVQGKWLALLSDD